MFDVTDVTSCLVGEIIYLLEKLKSQYLPINKSDGHHLPTD